MSLLCRKELFTDDVAPNGLSDCVSERRNRGDRQAVTVWPHGRC